ncbi:MAG: hypothetical protein AAGF97_03775 [Planctomycetota bacterium]
MWGNAGEVMFFAGMVLLAFFAIVAMVTSRLIDLDQISTWTQGPRFWFGLLVLSSVVFVGAYGLVRSLFQLGASAERRSVIARRAQAISEPATGHLEPPVEYPTVPKVDSLMESPGTRLGYRLAQQATPAWSLHALGLFSLMWFGFLGVLLAVVTKSFFDGNVRWFLLLITAVLVFVAVRMTGWFFRQIASAVRVGPTHVEISRLPLYPGEQALVSLTQTGRMTLTKLRLSLVCEEEAIFREGTNVRVEKIRAYEQSVLTENLVEVTPKRAIQLDGPIEVPVDAMHSFESPSNSIRWLLLVQGRQKAGANFERRFPLVVYPPREPRT